MRDVLKRSASLARPPPSSDSIRATLGACLQHALAATCLDEHPTPPPLPALEKPPATLKVTLANPFKGINPPPPAILMEGREVPESRDQAGPSCGRSITREAQSPSGSSGEKRRSNARPCGETNAKTGWQSEVQPAWDISNIGGRRALPPSSGCPTGSAQRHKRQPEGWRSCPPSEPDSPERSTKLKSTITAVKDKTPSRSSYESMGPAAWSQHDSPSTPRDSDRDSRNTRGKEDQQMREKLRPRSEAERRRDSRSRTKSFQKREEPRSHGRSYQESHPRESPRKDRNVGQTQSRPSGKKGFDKAAARREYEEQYNKVVTHPRKYLEKRYHQINPEFYQAEVHTMRYFGPTAEEATIEVLSLIDWAAEYMKLSNSPVPDILGFLQSPFVAGGAPARNPLPTDPGLSF